MLAGGNCVVCHKLGTEGVWTAQDCAVDGQLSVCLLE